MDKMTKNTSTIMAFTDHLANFAHTSNFLQNSSELDWVLLSNGEAYYHDSVIFFGIDKKSYSPVLVVKTPRLPENGWALKIEYDSLVELWDRMGENAVYYFPKPIALFEYEKQPALMLSYLKGESLLLSSKELFWNNLDLVFSLAVESAESLDKIFRSTFTNLEHEENPLFDFSRRTEKFQKMYPLSRLQNKTLEIILNKLEANRDNTAGKTLLQGDFWHGNLIRGAGHGKLMFVDWQYARWSADVSLDVYLFLLAGALAAVPDSSTPVRARRVVGVLLSWQKKIIPAYLEVFMKSNQYSLLPIRDGMLLCCVEKATRASMDFGHTQSDDEIWWYIFNEIMDWPDAG